MSPFSGEVKWFNSGKGYGFLSRDDGGKDVFVHFSAIQKTGYRSLKQGQRVDYEIIDGDGGPQADFVTVSTDKPVQS